MEGFTPLLCAVEKGDVNMVKLLLDYGATIEDRLPESQQTALHLCATNGQQGLVIAEVSLPKTIVLTYSRKGDHEEAPEKKKGKTGL
eukprot:m.46448 g.46448  ORF g.46448 m.46448 type:complete len:87 (-) comp12247_c0_seq5:809-1069(-)